MKIAAALFDLDETLADTLAAVETGSPAGVVKAEAIGRLLDGWAIDREAAIYVGDAAVDMRAARAAGVTAIGAAWAYGARPAELEPAGANLIFTDARDFSLWLRSAT